MSERARKRGRRVRRKSKGSSSQGKKKKEKEKKEVLAMNPVQECVPQDAPFPAFDQRCDHGRHVHLPSMGSAQTPGFQYGNCLRGCGSGTLGSWSRCGSESKMAVGGTRGLCSVVVKSAKVTWGTM